MVSRDAPRRLTGLLLAVLLAALPPARLTAHESEKERSARAAAAGARLLAERERLAKAAAERESQLTDLESRILDTGAKPEAVRELKRVLGVMLADVDVSVIERLNKNKVHIALIPDGKKLTDLPDFVRYKGKKIYDKRLYDDLPGLADEDHAGGGHVTAFREDNLLGPAGYKTKDFLAFHEFGHCVKTYGLDKAAADKAESAYRDSMKRKSKSGLGDYAERNSDEHFAQATAAYFGAGYEGEDAAKLKKANGPLHALMREIYGPRGRKKP